MNRQPKEEDKNAMRTLREKRGLTQAQAAARVDVSRSLWSALENKQRPLTVAFLNRMQVAFRLSEDEVTYLRTWWGDAHLSTSSAA